MMKRIRNQESGIRNWLIVFLLASCFLILDSNPAHAQSVDILWQGETYTPPFYKGKTLWSNQSSINFVAIPQGLGSPANLDYKWTKNGTVLGNASGVGRNYLPFIDPILSRTQTIKVDIVSNEKGLLASASVSVTPIPPTLVVYENNPLYGLMFHRETTGVHELQGREITFTAFPFFFSILDRRDNTVGYEWQTNVEGVETRNSVTYRTPDNVSGSSPVSVRASNKDKIMQSANQSFLIQFGEE